MKIYTITISPKHQKLLERLGFYNLKMDRFEVPVGLILIITLALAVAAIRLMGGLNA